MSLQQHYTKKQLTVSLSSIQSNSTKAMSSAALHYGKIFRRTQKLI